MARINNLTNFLTDVATSIKTKTGDSTAIPASQFDTKIANITTGHLDNEEYEEANDDLDDILEGTTPIKIYPPDWSEIGYEDTPESVINGFNYAKTIKDNWDSSITSMASLYRNDYELLVFPLVDTSNVTNMEYTFTYSNIREIPLLNTSNVGSFASMFECCYSLMSVPKINTSHSTSFSGMFKYCSSLKNVPIFDCSNAVNLRNMFGSCGKLTNESLNNIMAICINVTRVSTSNKTLSYLGLSSAQATICQSLSNYSAFIAAGWTTGY